MNQAISLTLPKTGPVLISANVHYGGPDLLVFLHGLGCAKESFSGAFESPGLRRFSLCAFDFPGHGRSESPRDLQHTLDVYAAITQLLVRRVRRELGIDDGKVLLVGHSMGGSVGLLATHDMDSLSHYISVDGNLVADDCGLVSRRTADQSTADFIGFGHRSFLDELENSAGDDMRAWATWYGSADPAAVHQSARSLVEWSDSGKLLDILHGLPTAKTYIYGARENKDHLLPRLADCNVHRLPEAGHFLMVEKSEEFYDLLTAAVNAPAPAG